MNPDCIFCKILDNSIPSQKIFETDRVLAFLDIHPINPGHCIIIPKRHADQFLATPPEDIDAIMRAVKKLAPVLLKVVGADSFNLFSYCGRAAGQVVFHTHFHLIPRFPADGYRHWEKKDDAHVDLQAMEEKIRKAFEGSDA